MTGTKSGRDRVSGRQTDTLRDRLGNARRRRQAHDRLAARLKAGEQQDERDD